MKKKTCTGERLVFLQLTWSLLANGLAHLRDFTLRDYYFFFAIRGKHLVFIIIFKSSARSYAPYLAFAPFTSQEIMCNPWKTSRHTNSNTLKKRRTRFFLNIASFYFSKTKTIRDSEGFLKDGACAKKPQVSNSFCSEVIYEGRKKTKCFYMHFHKIKSRFCIKAQYFFLHNF